MINDKTEKLEIVYFDPAELVPYENNSKIHSEEQIIEIARQISGFGWDVPIVLDENKVVLKGHGRRLAAMSMNYTKVPCIVRRNLTPEEKIAIRIGDNKVSDLGTWDKDKLMFDLGTLQRADFDLELTAIPAFELSTLVDTGEVEHDKGAGMGGASEKSFTIQYTLIFNTVEEQQSWFEFLGALKQQNPHIETVAQRVLNYIEEKGI